MADFQPSAIETEHSRVIRYLTSLCICSTADLCIAGRSVHQFKGPVPEPNAQTLTGVHAGYLLSKGGGGGGGTG